MGGSVRQSGTAYILKSGSRVKTSEAAAMVFVQQQTDVPVPKLIKSKFDAEGEQGFLWMTIVPGCTLDTVWNKLNDDTKCRLCQSTWKLIAKIRDIKRPPNLERILWCSANGSTTHDPLIEDLNQPPRPSSTMMPCAQEYTSAIYITLVDAMRTSYLMCSLAPRLLFSPMQI